MTPAFPKALCRQLGLAKPAAAAAEAAFAQARGQLEALLENPWARFLSLCGRALRRDKAAGAAFTLAAALAVADTYTRAQYRKRGIPEAVYLASLGDIALWVRDAEWADGVLGLCNAPWIAHTLFLELFWLGRLQFEFFETDYRQARLPKSARKIAPFPDGAKVLNVHIPARGRLRLSEAEASFSAAEAFFHTYFPEFAFAGFVCDSWLLDERNRRFMRPDSNILQFFSAFDLVVPTRRKNRELLRRLWGRRRAGRRTIAALSENTSLQRAAKAYLLAGGKSYNGYGFRRLQKNGESPLEP